MFSFGKRKKAGDVQRRMRRLCNLTMPGLEHEFEGVRRDNRVNRSLAAVLAPWERRGPDVDRCLMVVTKDLGDAGASLIATHPVTTSAIVLGFWVPDTIAEQPWFFLGDVRHSTPLGGGFWTIGIELTEVLEDNELLERLTPWARKLRPPLEPATAT